MKPIVLNPDARSRYSSKWAANRITLLDVAIANETTGLAELIDETAAAFPEITLTPSRPIKGTIYQTLFRVQNPTVSFRDANEGTEAVKSRYEKRAYECHHIDARWEADKSLAASLDDGIEAYLAAEADATMRAVWQHIARQTYYGLGNDGKGFVGFNSVVHESMIVNAGGSAAATGSSVWGVRYGQSDVQFLMGGNAELLLSGVDLRDVRDANNKVFEAFVQTLAGHIGLKIGNYWAVGQIRNLTTDTGKGLTDDRVAELLNKYPAGTQPDVLLMTKRSREQLRQSRKTDLLVSPPIPTESHGVPIQVTDALRDNEPIVA